MVIKVVQQTVTRIVFPVLLVLSWVVVHAQTPGVSASLDSSTYRIGEWIDLRVNAHMPPELQASGPLAGDSAGSFEILEVRELEGSLDGGKKHQSWVIRLITFEPGQTAIPPLVFRFLDRQGDSVSTAATRAITVSIDSVALDEQAELKDIKPPLTPSWTVEDAIPYAIVLLIIAAIAGGYYLYSKRRKDVREVEPPKPAVPPHQIALAALRELEDKKLWQQGKVKEYYSEATEIIRRFFEGRFGIIALELTSDEILQQLKAVPAALPLWKDITAFFLTADLVKFAKYQPTMAEHDAELQMAYALVRAMTPKPEPPVSEEVSSDAG